MKEKEREGRASWQTVLQVWSLPWRSEGRKEDWGRKLQPGHWGVLEPIKGTPSRSHGNGPLYVTLLCPGIGWEQLKENMALGPTWWWVQSVAAGLWVSFTPSSLNGASSWPPQTQPHPSDTLTVSIIWFSITWRVAGTKQCGLYASEYVLGLMKKKMLPLWGNLTLESLWEVS